MVKLWVLSAAGVKRRSKCMFLAAVSLMAVRGWWKENWLLRAHVCWTFDTDSDCNLRSFHPYLCMFSECFGGVHTGAVPTEVRGPTVHMRWVQAHFSGVGRRIVLHINIKHIMFGVCTDDEHDTWAQLVLSCDLSCISRILQTSSDWWTNGYPLHPT